MRRRRRRYRDRELSVAFVALTKDRGTEDPFACRNPVNMACCMITLNPSAFDRIKSQLFADQSDYLLSGGRRMRVVPVILRPKINCIARLSLSTQPSKPHSLNSINHSLPRGPKVRRIKGDAAIRLDGDYV